MHIIKDRFGNDLAWYDDWLEEACALQAFLIGDYGSLTCVEIEAFTEVAREIGLLPRLPFGIAELPAPTRINYIYRCGNEMY